MSIYLIISLGVLLLGAAIVAVLAWYRPSFAPSTAAVVVAIALLSWLLAGQNLTFKTGLEIQQDSAGVTLFSWGVDRAGWQLSFFLLLMIQAVLVVLLARTDRLAWSPDRPARQKALFPAVLLLGAASLLTIWASSVASVLTTWVVVSLTWLFALWTMTEARVSANRLLPRAGALLLGALFLWLATATTSAATVASGLRGPWSGASAYLLLLAAIAPLGALPLQWWRPLAWSLPTETAAIVHLAPVAAGGSLLIRSGWQASEQEPGLLLIATLLGLLSVLVGVSIAWMYVASPSRSLSGLALAQAGMVVLAAAWAGSSAALAATQLLILAISSLFLAARWSPRRLPWPAVVPLLALAGFPLTAGVDGVVSVYDAWLGSGRAVLLLIGALLSMFMLAAGILTVRREVPTDELVGRSVWVKTRHHLALALPSLGLLMFSNQALTDIAVVAWITVALAIIGALLLNRFEAQIQDGQLSLRRALHLGFAGRRSMRVLTDTGSALDSLIREMAAILEGEGGMLWLLIFLVVIWLARS